MKINKYLKKAMKPQNIVLLLVVLGVVFYSIYWIKNRKDSESELVDVTTNTEEVVDNSTTQAQTLSRSMLNTNLGYVIR